MTSRFLAWASFTRAQKELVWGGLGRGGEETVGAVWDLVSGKGPLRTWEGLCKGSWQSNLCNCTIVGSD